MARTEVMVGESIQKGKGVRKRRQEGGKYARYSEDQIEVLEKAYAVCSNPTHFQRQQIMRDQPALRGIDHKQLKVWFQNRRCREKQKKESGDVASENRRLNEANKMLKEENDGLQKKLTQLISENGQLRNQVLGLTSTISTYQLGHQPEASNPQLPVIVADKGLVSLAEETRKEFLSKAIGTAINWVPVPWPKLQSPVSAGIIYTSSSCIGVAARAYVTVPLEPFKIIEIFKDRASWSRHCRNMDVIARFPANNGGTIELIYTQYYAPTMMACARDFWTLRYTSLLDDGCFVICERSISGSDAAPSSPAALEFVRGKLLASGCMIRPSEGGSTIYLVEHLDLEASSVPEVVRPLYESSEIVAKKMILSVLNYIDNVVNEKNGIQTLDPFEEPTFRRSFSHRLSRGFNDAVNCFSEDGWALMNPDASDDVIMSIRRTKPFGVSANFDSIICVKSSLLLQNVFPASMVRLLKERRSNWMNFDFTSHSVAFSRAACFAFPGVGTHNLSETAVLLGHTNHEDEILEIVRFDNIPDRQHNASSGDLYHLQISNGMEDTDFGTCSELIFAPIDRNIPDDAVLLSSGFRIYLGTSSYSNLASNEAYTISNGQAVINNLPTMLIIAFQFPFQSHLVEDVEAMARDYLRHVISCVKQISLEAMLPGLTPETNSIEANLAMEFNVTSELDFVVNLANLMCQCYRSSLGVDMLGFNCHSTDSVLEQMQSHPYAILCFSLASVPVCIYANLAGLTMLETTPDNLQALSVDRILGSSYNLSLYSVLPTILQQGYAMLPPGYTLSVMNRGVSYGQAVVWQVQASDGSVNGLGLAFIDWCFTDVF
ncbi:homeobox-leucine zipper protein REVOLUTA-like isoform X2 [Salvia miltiorrhiza]|uniref:homeobox-leucine zipper protein REVOLUTA-like isoform X2 n=1 Tax=Salvia miltiorrhiza TaxID=226208 RepID=UPI0025AD8006|nr:homeobox-leucine zipper protein REVOLUTA-like isoform X2 [Salvia miltiorrhiza]